MIIDAMHEQPQLTQLDDWTEFSEQILSTININLKKRCSFVQDLFKQLNGNSSLSKTVLTN